MTKLELSLIASVVSILATGIFLSLYNVPKIKTSTFSQSYCQNTYKSLNRGYDGPGPGIKVTISYDPKNNKCQATCKNDVTGEEFGCPGMLTPDTPLPTQQEQK